MYEPGPADLLAWRDLATSRWMSNKVDNPGMQRWTLRSFVPAHATKAEIDCHRAQQCREFGDGVIAMWLGFCRFLRACTRRLFVRETIFCVLGLLPGSILVMARLPPLWRDYDGLGQLTSPPGNMTLLGFPALYPFLSRLPILLVSAWNNAGHLHSLQLGVNRWVALNDGGLLVLVAGQQLALLFALALLTVGCARRPILRCLIVVVSSAIPFFLSGHN